jgi:hypothetical protein
VKGGERKRRRKTLCDILSKRVSTKRRLLVWVSGAGAGSESRSLQSSTVDVDVVASHRHRTHPPGVVRWLRLRIWTALLNAVRRAEFVFTGSAAMCSTGGGVYYKKRNKTILH